MCGIVGYVGNKKAAPILLEGLRKLEYRGYDSAGIVTSEKKKFSLVKEKGKISGLGPTLAKVRSQGLIGLGHTRWATHGRPSKLNSHPHFDCSKRIVLVHNGIIENFAELKKELKVKGCKFISDTDTEVVVHLISRFFRGDLREAVARALKRIKGSFALGVMSLDDPGKIIAARRDSPLVIGLGKQGNFIASDVSPLLEHTNRFIYMNEDQIAVITENEVKISDLKGKTVKAKVDTLSLTIDQAKKGEFKHFMLKEILEQPKVISNILSHYLKSTQKIEFPHCNISKDFLGRVKNIIILACGTAYHSGLVGKYIIESFTRIPVWVDLGSEFRYRRPVIGKDTLVIAISQSGETADTLAAVREAKKAKVKVISICNVLGSTLTRESDSIIYAQAGPEISVASTKAYTAQLTILYLLGLYLAGLKKSLSLSQIRKITSSLKEVPAKQRKIFQKTSSIKKIAKKHLHYGAFLFLGRNINFPTALEGALKLKEISYIPAEGYAAGEMKHGPIALIDEYRAVVCVADDSFVFDKMISNIQEILARKGKIIIVATQGNKRIKDYSKEIIYIPRTHPQVSPLLTIIPLQLLAYYVACLKGYDVDKPRNLAKSVTVE